MSRRLPPWYWNEDTLKRLAWLLLALVFAAYAGRALGATATALLPSQAQWFVRL
jgi:hypothetical protein